MALGRFGACVELYFARWVSAVSVQISNVYLLCVPITVFGRF